VTATASTLEKLEWLLSLPSGATHVANYKTQDFSEVVKKVTDNKGVDVIIDFVGQSHWGRNIESLAVDGRMTMLALLSGNMFPYMSISRFVHLTVRFHFDLKQILYKRLRIQGSTLRSRSVPYQADLIQRYVLTMYHPFLPSIKLTIHVSKISTRGSGSHHGRRRNRSRQSLHFQSIPTLEGDQRLYLIIIRFILGPRYKMLTELWKAMRTGQLVFSLVLHWLNFHTAGK
jgi:hypothetical protein